MVIRMSQSTQIARAALATVRREITRIFALSAAQHSSEHWQVTETQTSRRRSRAVTKSVVWGLSCALLFVGCNVYDASLLDSSALASGGSNNAGGSPVLAGGAGDANGGASSNASGGAGTSAGGIGLAGADNAGDSSSGTSGSGAGTAGGVVVTGGSGGTSAGGQAGDPAGGTASVTLSLIDDMENVDPYIPTNDGRQGFWSLSNDGTSGGKQTPSPMLMAAIPGGGRGASLSALHTTAMGFTVGGALVAVDLNRKGTSRQTYDASAYTGVHFWTRVESGSPTAVHFAILDKHTDPGGALCCISIAPMNCAGGGSAANGLCYDHFGKDLPPATTQWVERTVTFAELGQVGWSNNNVTALDAAHVFAIQFNWTSAAMDLWIDDIS